MLYSNIQLVLHQQVSNHPRSNVDWWCKRVQQQQSSLTKVIGEKNLCVWVCVMLEQCRDVQRQLCWYELQCHRWITTICHLRGEFFFCTWQKQRKIPKPQCVKMFTKAAMWALEVKNKRLKSFRKQQQQKDAILSNDRPAPEHKHRYRIKLKNACFIILCKQSILRKLATCPPLAGHAGCGTIEWYVCVQGSTCANKVLIHHRQQHSVRYSVNKRQQS